MVTLWLVLCLDLPARTSLTQSIRVRPPRDHFGDSLKRLRWDPSKGRADEIKTGGGGQQGGDEIVRVETRLAVCEFDVYGAKGRKAFPVPDLSEGDFAITVDGQPQQIAHFSRGDDPAVPRSVVLVIDYSASQLPFIDRSIDTAEMLVDALGPGDRLAVVTDDVALLSDFTSDKAALKAALESLRKAATVEHRFGRSDQFSALLAAARELFTEDDLRRVIVFQTDGDELGFLQPPDGDVLRSDRFRPRIKQYGIGDVYAGVERSRAMVHTVTAGFPYDYFSPGERLKAARAVMEAIDGADQPGAVGAQPPANPKKISKAQLTAFVETQMKQQVAVGRVSGLTGGSGHDLLAWDYVPGWPYSKVWPHPSTTAEQDKVLAATYGSYLRGWRYAIGFYPTSKPRDGKRHEVLISVRNHPEYIMVGRKYFYAPGPED